MTPQNEAWIREVATMAGTGTAVTIARLCLAEIDSLRNRIRPVEGTAEVRVSAEYIGIPKERLAFLERRDRRLTEWDTWAADQIYGDETKPMPVPTHRARKARSRQRGDQVSLTNPANGVRA